jgi:hypothetical protein
MFSKINVIKIIIDQLNTIRGSEDKPFSDSIFWSDMILFYFIPLLIASLMILVGITPTENLINSSMIALTIFVPLLVNVIFLIYNILEQAKICSAEQSENTNRTKNIIILLHELFCNISYSILVSFFMLILLFITYCTQKLQINFLLLGINYFLGIHLILTGLMILKRLHILLGISFGR